LPAKTITTNSLAKRRETAEKDSQTATKYSC
jgi:hypothetical protein